MGAYVRDYGWLHSADAREGVSEASNGLVLASRFDFHGLRLVLPVMQTVAKSLWRLKSCQSGNT